MATSSIVVHDIDKLEGFGTFLSEIREDIADSYDSLTRECLAQEQNWQNQQYDTLKDELESFVSTSKMQLEALEESASYISRLVDKLRDV